LAERLESALRAEILSGELQPGARLRAEEIAVRYQVSHTPIREALRSLAADSLISLDPRLGAQVAQISMADLEDVYRLRILLEREALAASINAGSDDWEVGLQRATERLSDAFRRHSWSSRLEAATARSEAHRAFDAALFAACGSVWLLRFVDTLSSHSERYRAALRSVRGIERDVDAEHLAIASAALQRDVALAQERLESHLRLTFEMMRDHLASIVDGPESAVSAAETTTARS
jgi:GntR family carbon starvation induced transcriptional regulator